MATGFVESATLKLNQKNALRSIQAANRALRDLNRTAQKLKRSFQGINFDRALRTERAAADLRSLNSALIRTQQRVTALRRSAAQPINIRTNYRQTGIPAGGAGGRRGGGVGPYVGGGILGSLSQTPFPGNLATAFNIGVAYLTFRGAVTLGMTATQATLDAQRVETQREIVVSDPAAREQLENLAIEGTRNARRVSLTRAQEILQDLYVGGLRGEELDALAPRIVEQEGLAVLLSKDQAAAQAMTVLANKVLNLANATEDVERSLDIMSGVYAGAIVQGESFNAATNLAALRTAGFANTISGEGLVGFALATDALGRQAGSSLQRLSKELVTPLSQAGAGAGIAKGAVERLVGTGIRGEEGITKEQADRFFADPIRFIQTDIRRALEEMSVDIEDRVAVTQALSQAGFAQTSQRLIRDSLAAITETERARTVASNLLSGEDAETAAADDLGAALRDLTTSFQTFSSVVLDPLFKALAPAATNLGDFLENVALSGSKIEQFGVIAGAAGIALGGFLGVRKITSLLNPFRVSAAALTGSAVQLDAAAVALMRAAGVQAVSGAGGIGGKTGRWGRFLGGATLGRLFGVAGAGAIGANWLFGGGARAGDNTSKYAGVSDNPSAVTRYLRNLAGVESSSHTKTYRLSDPMGDIPKAKEGSVDKQGRVLANVITDGLVMRADDWGKNAGDAMASRMVTAMDTVVQRLADKIKYAIDSASIQVAGISSAAAGADVGYSTSGDGGGATLGAVPTASGYHVGR